MSKIWNLKFENNFAKLPENFYTKLQAENVPADPWLIHANAEGAKLIDLDSELLKDKNFLKYFSGKKLLPGLQPLAMVYSGHQFGHWAGQLGDGRALLLGQIRNKKNELWDVQLKGSGKTPYSRFGDGRAVLRSCIREYLCSEAMFGLSIPTTRSLCVIGTGEVVFRETPEPGAIFTRLSPTHIRFGHFEHFYYLEKFAEIKILADYVIKEHFPEISNAEDRYKLWFESIVKLTAELIAKWQAVGFSHGVINTDNMSIAGLTIDYGPFGFIENFNPAFICNHSDPRGRYSYQNQPNIGLWNLYALAQSLQPLIIKDASLEILKNYDTILTENYNNLMCKKLGLSGDNSKDNDLWLELLNIMFKAQSDYTLTFRYLSASFTNKNKWLNLFSDKELASSWLEKYHARLKLEKNSLTEIAKKLNSINPKFVLRNWVAEYAIREVQDNKNYQILDDMLKIFHNPFKEHKSLDRFSQNAPKQYQDLCVSCSS